MRSIEEVMGTLPEGEDEGEELSKRISPIKMPSKDLCVGPPDYLGRADEVGLLLPRDHRLR